MGPIRLAWVGALLALGLQGCANVPSYVLRAEQASIRGNDAGRTARLAQSFEADRAFVLEELPGTRSVDLEVWEVEGAQGRRLEELNADGLTERRSGALPWIWLWPLRLSDIRVLLQRDAEPRVLTHELVHALLGPDWSPLPSALEEGLADYMAFRRHPHTRGPWQHWNALLDEPTGAVLEIAIQRGRGRGNGSSLAWSGPSRSKHRPAPSLREVLELPDRTPWQQLDSLDVRYSYAVGYALIDRLEQRLSLEGLLGLCREAKRAGRSRLDSDLLLELAGLPEGRFPVAELQAERDRALARVELIDLGATPVVQELFERYAEPQEPIGSFLRRLRGRLRSPSGDSIDWRALPRWRAFLASLELPAPTAAPLAAPNNRKNDSR